MRDGILCHTRGTEAFTAEGRIVRLADRIAYINHDIEDACRAGVITEKDIPESITKFLGSSKSQRISTLIRSVVENTREGNLRMDPDVQRAFDELHDFMYDRVYLNEYAKREEKKIPHLVEALYEYAQKIDHLPEGMRAIAEQEGTSRAACDFIAGMTDQYAISLYRRLFIPQAWKVFS